jgi:hypothetical protein
MTQPNYLFFRIDNAQISMCERLTEFWGAKKIQSPDNFRLAFCFVINNSSRTRGFEKKLMNQGCSGEDRSPIIQDKKTPGRKSRPGVFTTTTSCSA